MQEDDKLRSLVAKYGPKKWATIAEVMSGRVGKQCRERWHNHLSDDVIKTPWLMDEDLIIFEAHRSLVAT
jgi:hypothetical protein